MPNDWQSTDIWLRFKAGEKFNVDELLDKILRLQSNNSVKLNTFIKREIKATQEILKIIS